MSQPTLSRRGLIMGAAGGAALSLTGLPQMLRAQDSAMPLPTIYDRMVGDLRLTTLLDGYFDLGQEIVTNLDPDLITTGMEAAYLDTAGPIPLSISTHILRAGDEITLIDAGAGAAFGPTAGRLGASLLAIGIDPAAVTRIVLTHMHPDHIGGLVTDSGAVFANAAVHVASAEHAFWTDEAIASGAPEDAQGFFALARAVSAAYGDRVTLFDGDVDLGGGLTTIAMPGHTPGHTGLRVADGSDELIIWGDSTAVAALQFSHPDSGIAFDADGAQAAQTRRRILDMVVADKTAVAGTHLPFPGIGHVAAKDDAYTWVPEEWQHL